MLNLVFALALIFVLVSAVARLMHRYFIYIPDRVRVTPEEAGVAGVEEVVFKAADGTRLIAWHLPARGSKPTLLYFTGNSGNVAERAGKIATIGSDGYGVFMLNYRSYGGSEGRPTEARIAADALTAYDYLRGLGVPPDRIIAYGESLGTAVATGVALHRQVKALVFEAPLTSAVDAGRIAWPLLPLGLLMVDQFRVLDRVPQVKVPLFIFHGGRDTHIPLSHARRIYHAANEPKDLAVLPRAGHNDLFEKGAWPKVHAFLEALRPDGEIAEPARAGRQMEMIVPAASIEHR
jgi:fermentation-respiration switch protein FrsA (DUF1100 family)